MKPPGGIIPFRWAASSRYGGRHHSVTGGEIISLWWAASIGISTHAVLYHRKPHEDALRSWAKKLIQTKPFKLVAVALANKLARIAFAIMRGKTSYSAAPA